MFKSDLIKEVNKNVIFKESCDLIFMLSFDIMKTESKFVKWLKAAGVRALKTMAQTAAATIGVSALMSEVNWLAVGSASLLAGILSLLTSLAGLPELEGRV